MTYHWGDFTAADLDQDKALEELAAAFALRDQAEAEDVIDSFCSEAIGQWRLKDARFWQRVKYRARLLRKRGPGAGDRDSNGRK